MAGAGSRWLRFYLFLFKGGGEAAGRKASGTRAELRCAGEKNAPAIYLITDLARARALAVILVPRQTQFLAFSGFLSLSLSPCVWCSLAWYSSLSIISKRFHFTTDLPAADDQICRSQANFIIVFISLRPIGRTLFHDCARAWLLATLVFLAGLLLTGRLHPTGKCHHPFVKPRTIFPFFCFLFVVDLSDIMYSAPVFFFCFSFFYTLHQSDVR
jgi:hypothetical protein